MAAADTLDVAVCPVCDRRRDDHSEVEADMCGEDLSWTEDVDEACWRCGLDAPGDDCAACAVIDRLDDPPTVERWWAVGGWLGLEASADTRDGLIAELGDEWEDFGDGVARCPCIDGGDCPGDEDGDGDCCCEPDCRGGCWTDREAPPGCWQTIHCAGDWPLVPVRRGHVLGWAAVSHHDHSPGPGGRWVVPDPDGGDVRGCGGWSCAGTVADDWIDVEVLDLDDLDDDAAAVVAGEWLRRGRDTAASIEALL